MHSQITSRQPFENKENIAVTFSCGPQLSKDRKRNATSLASIFTKKLFDMSKLIVFLLVYIVYAVSLFSFFFYKMKVYSIKRSHATNKDHLIMLRLLFIDETLHEDGVKWTELIAIHSFFVLRIIKVYICF